MKLIIFDEDGRVEREVEVSSLKMLEEVEVESWEIELKDGTKMIIVKFKYEDER